MASDPKTILQYILIIKNIKSEHPPMKILLYGLESNEAD